MELCLEQARKSTKRGDFPFGSCVTMNNRLVSASGNSQKTHRDLTAHAEVEAIRLATRKLNTANLAGCVLYTSAEPCLMCYGAAYWARVTRIVFSARVEDIVASKADRPLAIPIGKLNKLGHARIELVGDVLRQKSRKILYEWSRRYGESESYRDFMKEV